jgi:hypothetical protein
MQEPAMRPAFALIGLLAAAPAAADPPGAGSTHTLRRPVAGHPVLHLRGGVDAAPGLGAGDRPTICGELAPHRAVSFEACGRGSGTLHTDSIPDAMHLRVRAVAARVERGRLDAALLPGLGVMEVQNGADRPGLRFSADDPVESAGPEVSLSAQGRWYPTPRAYLVMDVNVGVAHVPGAPTVMGAASPILPFAGISAGAGF